jgi:hypothetical protein
MRTVYRALLHLYPYDYRVWFSAEMRTVFELRLTERDWLSFRAFLAFVISELIGLVTGALAEWTARLSTDPSVRARSLPDLRMMRPPGISRDVHFSDACIRAWVRTLAE